MRAFALPLLACVAASSACAEEVTRAEAEALVKSAIAFARSRGKDAAYKEITRPGGPFHKHGGELYVFVYDLNGKVLAHGQGAAKVGLDQSNAKDPEGREYVRERIQLATTKGKGWHDYKFRNPVSNRIESKSSYIEVWGGVIFGAGIYKK